MRIFKIALAAAVAFTASPAVGQPPPVLGDFGTADGWWISRLPRQGGCAMSMEYMDGSALAVILNTTEPRLVLSIANESWRTLRAGQTITLRVVLDGTPQLERIVTATGSIGNDGLPMFFAPVPAGLDFLAGVMRSEAMSVYRGNALVARLSLAGSRAAGTSMVTCATDPFAGSI